MVSSDRTVRTYVTKHVQVVITSTVCATLVVSQAGKETTAMNVNKHYHNTFIDHNEKSILTSKHVGFKIFFIRFYRNFQHNFNICVRLLVLQFRHLRKVAFST